MRKLIVLSFLTLDGVMQAPGGPNEDPSGGFTHGGWQSPYLDEDNPMVENLPKAGALLLGRKTYDIFASYWPNEGKNVEWFGPFMNSIPKLVASRTLKTADWQNSTLLEGDVATAISKLKKENGKDIYVLGSGDLLQTFMRHQLVDEYLLMIHPLTLGQGKRLFRNDGPKQDFELTHSRVSQDGILVVTYQKKESK